MCIRDRLRDDPSYYDWIMRGDFTKNTKDCFTRIYMRVKSARK